MNGFRSLTLFLSVALSTQALGWAGADPNRLAKASRICQRGFEFLESGDAVRAEGYFRRALRLVEAHPEGHIGLGHVAMEERRFEDALQEYLRARDGYTRLAQQLFDLEVKRFHDMRAKLPRLRNELLMIQMGDHRWSHLDRRFQEDQLIQRIRDLETMQPPGKEASLEPPGRLDFFVGNALARLGRWDEAVQAYEASLSKSPRLSAAYGNLSLAYWRTGRLEEAAEILRKAEDLGFDVDPRFKTSLERSLRDIEPESRTPHERS